MTTAPLLAPLLASDVAFAVLFGAFVAAFVVLCVIVLRWALRRDSAGRAAWRARQSEGQGVEGQRAADDAEPPPAPPT
jgi:hypothetical protein